MKNLTRTGIAAALILSAGTTLASNTLSLQGAVTYPSCQSGIDSSDSYTTITVNACGNRSLPAALHIAQTYLEPIEGTAASRQPVKGSALAGQIYERIVASHSGQVMRYVIEYR